MATRYYYQREGIDTGPVSFRELVVLVREETLREDDPVRSEWEAHWQPAAEVVGLFHLAGRDDVLARWLAEKRRQAAAQQDETATQFSEGELDELLNTAASIPDERAATLPVKARAASPPTLRIHTLDLNDDSRLAEAIQSAEQAATASTHASGRSPRWPGWTLSQLFRWGFALVLANLAALQIIGWTRTELLRFPDATRAVQGACLFPYWGPCSYTEYAFLLTDAMLLFGVIGYGLACGLESLTQD